MAKFRCVKVLLFFSALSFAETPAILPDIKEVPPPPVVSALSASVAGNTVTLAWVPAVDLVGDSIILRSDRPITASTAASAERRGTVASPETSFKDTIESGKEYYYAVLSRDPSGTEYVFFIPASNALLVPVYSGERQAPVGNATITGFGAIRKDDSVILTWAASLRRKNLVLYRSTEPFSGISSLAQAVVVTSSAEMTSPYIDYPVPGVSWYYAIIDEDVLKTASVTFLPGENTNGVPVEIPASFARLKRSSLSMLRPMPLPWLNPSRKAVAPRWNFSASTEEMLGRLVGAGMVGKGIQRRPYVFKSDMESASGGESWSLKAILDGPFREGDWNRAIAELGDFLSVRRSAETSARAHFYLGEANFFAGKYRQSLLEFLLSQDSYYNQSREWIQYSLEKIVEGERTAT